MPFSVLTNTIPLPDKRDFPSKLQNIGNHIKKVRLERRILIKDVIAALNINRETLRGWELNLFQPHVGKYPSIIHFLGYKPYHFDPDSLAGKIKDYRYRHGLTQKQFGELLQTDGSVVWQWESNNRLPISKTQKRILKLIENDNYSISYIC